MPHALATNPAEDSTVSIQALNKLMRPAGRCLLRVRGFCLSNLRSTMRLKAIAHVRAVTIAAMIRRNIFQPGQPRSMAPDGSSPFASK